MASINYTIIDFSVPNAQQLEAPFSYPTTKFTPLSTYDLLWR
jgi:hypothetical protein